MHACYAKKGVGVLSGRAKVPFLATLVFSCLPSHAHSMPRLGSKSEGVERSASLLRTGTCTGTCTCTCNFCTPSRTSSQPPHDLDIFPPTHVNQELDSETRNSLPHAASCHATLLLVPRDHVVHVVFRRSAFRVQLDCLPCSTRCKHTTTVSDAQCDARTSVLHSGPFSGLWLCSSRRPRSNIRDLRAKSGSLL